MSVATTMLTEEQTVIYIMSAQITAALRSAASEQRYPSRSGDEMDSYIKEKLELAIIENLQREDLNPIDRAQAFLKLAEEFKLTHAEIGKKMGKSREYVSNTLRLLSLPEEIRQALADKKIAEGHTRPPRTRPSRRALRSRPRPRPSARPRTNCS